MNRRLLEIRQRRSELLARIDAQRQQLAGIAVEWQAPLALADQGLAVVRFLRRHPVVLAGAVALAVVRRRGLAGLLKTASQVWIGYRYLGGP